MFADFIKNIAIENKNPLPIIGDGEQIRCFTWIGDVSRVIADFSFDDRAKNQVYNIGNPEPITMKQLAKYIHQGEEDLDFTTVKEYNDDVLVRIPDITKIINDLGFKPTKKVQDSIETCMKFIAETIGEAK